MLGGAAGAAGGDGGWRSQMIAHHVVPGDGAARINPHRHDLPIGDDVVVPAGGGACDDGLVPVTAKSTVGRVDAHVSFCMRRSPIA